jgi:hypothetical protein
MKSQNEEILKHLKTGKAITSLSALKLFNCLRLSGRIYDLRKAGYNIISKPVTTITKKRIAAYRLVK